MRPGPDDAAALLVLVILTLAVTLSYPAVILATMLHRWSQWVRSDDIVAVVALLRYGRSLALCYDWRKLAYLVPYLQPPDICIEVLMYS